MLDELKKYFEIYPGTPFGRKGSVHYHTCRFEKAKEQASLIPVDAKIIISYVNDFLEKIRMEKIKSPEYQPQEINYQKIQSKYNLESEKNLVWMKFTQDGYLGVVASGNDVNFDRPSSASQYHEEEWSHRFNKYIWKYNTSGILIHHLKKAWNTSFVLIFPLSKIPDGYARENIECAIGNYLIEKGIPILDFYSHNYLTKHQNQGKEFPFTKKELLTVGDYFAEGGETYTYDELQCRIENDLGLSRPDASLLIKKCVEQGFITDCGGKRYTR